MGTPLQYYSFHSAQPSVLTSPRAAGTRAIPRCRDSFQPRDYWSRGCGCPSSCSRLYQSCGYGSAEKSIFQHCSQWGHYTLHWYVEPWSYIIRIINRSRLRRPTLERSKKDERREDQDICSSRTKIFNVDWRVHPCWFEYFQKGVPLHVDSLFLPFNHP